MVEHKLVIEYLLKEMKQDGKEPPKKANLLEMASEPSTGTDYNSLIGGGSSLKQEAADKTM